MSTPVKKRPDGFHTVNPYLVVNEAEKIIDYLMKVFDAKIFGEAFKTPEGKIMHAVVQMGDSMVEIGDSVEPMPMNLHMYVDDVDGLYQRAVAAGGQSIREPETTFYGDRSAGVKDPGGNNWWLACHIEDVSNEEMMRRTRAEQS